MKAKLIIEGREFDIDILDPELQKLVKPSKKTGYELRKTGQSYYIDGDLGLTEILDGTNDGLEQERYETANYYSDETVAKNNARADRLMRQLRRFKVEHKKYGTYWTREPYEKWSIVYDYSNGKLVSDKCWSIREAFVVYFSTKDEAELAIKTFYNELIWYFTEYKDSL